MNTIRCKPRKNSKSVQLVRYPYCPQRKRSTTLTIGSISLDADPDDVAAWFRPLRGKQPPSHSSSPLHLTENDLVVVKAWLLQHGDRRAAERRKVRDDRVKREMQERIREADGEDGDALTRVIEALRAAGELLVELANSCKSNGENPWDTLRGRYMKVLKAHEAFEERAKEAGVRITQKRKSSS